MDKKEIEELKAPSHYLEKWKQCKSMTTGAISLIAFLVIAFLLWGATAFYLPEYSRQLQPDDYYTPVFISLVASTVTSLGFAFFLLYRSYKIRRKIGKLAGLAKYWTEELRYHPFYGDPTDTEGFREFMLWCYWYFFGTAEEFPRNSVEWQALATPLEGRLSWVATKLVVPASHFILTLEERERALHELHMLGEPGGEMAAASPQDLVRRRKKEEEYGNIFAEVRQRVDALQEESDEDYRKFLEMWDYFKSHGALPRDPGVEGPDGKPDPKVFIGFVKALRASGAEETTFNS